ncbi:Ribosomal RNA small subunit methyltransferase D [compost metagenome]
MRIIAGKYKGHQLVAFKADHIRPTTDRVKETLFNQIQFDIADASILDLFCGTGNLGLESLSRDASHCTFVEKNTKSLTITRQNIEKLKVPAGSYKIINMEVISFLKSYKGAPFDIILADPPFTEKMAHFVVEAASHSEAFGPNTLLAIESERKERMDDEYGDLIRYKVKEFGDKYLSMFRHKSSVAAPEEDNG